MHIDFLIDIFKKNSEKPAIYWGNQLWDYKWLVNAIKNSEQILKDKIEEYSVVSLEADFSPTSMAMFLALINHNCVIVPLTDSVKAKRAEFREVAEVEMIIKVDSNDNIQIEQNPHVVQHEILKNLKNNKHPGLILFSSGSTGNNKAAVHDFVPLLEKFKVQKQTKNMISFLLFDHIGGINTFLYAFSNAGFVVTVNERTPESICKAIEEHKVQILPVTPTFINLLLLSEVYKLYDLSSLEVVSYGTEPMPESVLKRFSSLYPDIKLQQTYGLSELGILRSKSKSSDSLWVKLGGDGFNIRIVDNMLEIKAKSAMLGYLNATSPFTEDGWFKTFDMVETDGEYMKILGRKSEIINVGGEKVYPAEVESIIMTMDGVVDIAVKGMPHPIMGNIVTAKVKLNTNEALNEFKKRMMLFCKDKIQKYKIPQKVSLIEEELHSERFKKMRK